MSPFAYCSISLTIFMFWTNSLSSVISEPFNDLNLPVIIWWTNMLFPHFGNKSVINCSKGSCLASSKRTYKNNHIYITYLFYGTNFEPEDLPLPRKKNHLWALLHEESPMNNYMLSHLPGITLFNFTSTFSRFSDHPLTTQFIPSLEYFTERKPISIDRKNELRKEGLASILYLQSHCGVASDRDSYMRELMKYVEVDSYGACLHNKDIPDHLVSTETYNDESLFSFIANYKFHIAFENALCDDYVTEKLYRAFHVGSVPVYKGSSTVKEWIPVNNSIIVTDDFTSPKELAKFLSDLDKNDTLYGDYLEFKTSGITNNLIKSEITKRKWGVNDINKLDFLQSFECFLCDKMYSMKNSSFFYVANKKHMHCPQPHPSFDQEEIDQMWLDEDWIENYWFSYDKAKAVQMMLQNKDKNTSNFMKYILQLKYQNQ